MRWGVKTESEEAITYLWIVRWDKSSASGGVGWGTGGGANWGKEGGRAPVWEIEGAPMHNGSE